MKFDDIVNGVKFPNDKNLAYPLNIDSLNWLKELWDFRLLNDNSQNISEVYSKSKKIQGNLMHRTKELILWASLANFNHILPNATICEIGYAFGFSAVVILNSNPYARYVGFDIGWKYSKNSWNIMKNMYSDRAQIFWGDSSSTILNTNFEAAQIICDVWIVDGNHKHEGVLKDVNAIISTSYKSKSTRKYPNNLIIFDDCDLGTSDINPFDIDSVIINHKWPIMDAEKWNKGPTKAFTEKIVDKNSKLLYIHHGHEIDLYGRGIHWCIATLNNSNSTTNN